VLAQQGCFRLVQCRSRETRTTFRLALEKLELVVVHHTNAEEIVAAHGHLAAVLPPQACDHAVAEFSRHIVGAEDLPEFARPGPLADRQLSVENLRCLGLAELT